MQHIYHLFKGRRSFSWNQNCLVDEGACVPHRYHEISDTFLHSLSIMYLFVSNLLLNMYIYILYVVAILLNIALHQRTGIHAYSDTGSTSLLVRVYCSTLIYEYNTKLILNVYYILNYRDSISIITLHWSACIFWHRHYKLGRQCVLLGSKNS